ncbi:MAG: insulinase family protein, partial [Muribaculaceae bacterium]|nr:insulinase family protein [Muribaculaceae bacterium]
SERVYDRFEDIFFAGNPLGHNILGSKESISAFGSEACRDWIRRYYTAPNMVFYYLGPASATNVIRLTERYFHDLNDGPAPLSRAVPASAERFFIRENHDGHQSHCVMGTTIPGMYSPDRYAMSLALNILGGPGMNARLNVSLRERRGLVYTVETSTTMLSDTGLATIYFGCDHADSSRCRALVAKELDRMASCALSPRALDAAKRQFIGQLTLGNDNKEQQALSMGRATLSYGHAALPGDTSRHISAITAQELQQAVIALTDSLNHCLILE